MTVEQFCKHAESWFKTEPGIAWLTKTRKAVSRGLTRKAQERINMKKMDKLKTRMERRIFDEALKTAMTYYKQYPGRCELPTLKALTSIYEKILEA